MPAYPLNKSIMEYIFENTSNTYTNKEAIQVTLIAHLTSRGCLLINAPETHISAGFPSPAQDYQGTQFDLDEIVVINKASTYIFRITGSSMINAGIADGDDVIVDCSIKPRLGYIIIAILDGEFTLKRFTIDDQGNANFYLICRCLFVLTTS